jgi:2,5-diketo-D-gluconate reductase B
MIHDVLANGAGIPAIGFGTYGMEREDMLRMIPAALAGGFRHIDTAQIYRNELEVGECTVSSGISRSELFITTKVWVANYPERRFAASVDESLKNLRTDYIDLLLLHWPHDGVPLADQIGLLNDTVKVGKVRHIGVSNFNRQLLDQAIRLSAAPLVTNQFEYHPYLNQSLLADATRKAGLAVTAYCAMAVGRVLGDPTIAQIAANHGRTIPQGCFGGFYSKATLSLCREPPIRIGSVKTWPFSTLNWARMKWPQCRHSQGRIAGSSIRLDWLQPGMFRAQSLTLMSDLNDLNDLKFFGGVVQNRG